MIPKVIHYCWFGKNPMPKKTIKCIESWKKYCSDYEIVCWDESNYDVNNNLYTRQAYQAKKWSFVSDFVRLDIIYKNGGIYLDTDVELIKNIDFLLTYSAFFGYEDSQYVNTGLGFGAEPYSDIIFCMMKEYIGHKFINLNGTYDLTPCPYYNTEALKKLGFSIDGNIRVFDNVCLFSKEYMCPINYSTGQMHKTENTFSIHWYDMSWKDEKEKRYTFFRRKLKKRFGKAAIIFEYPLIAYIIARREGIKGLIARGGKKFRNKLVRNIKRNKGKEE